jgi:hypothetical protein
MKRSFADIERRIATPEELKAIAPGARRSRVRVSCESLWSLRSQTRSSLRGGGEVPNSRQADDGSEKADHQNVEAVGVRSVHMTREDDRFCTLYEKVGHGASSISMRRILRHLADARCGICHVSGKRGPAPPYAMHYGDDLSSTGLPTTVGGLTRKVDRERV